MQAISCQFGRPPRQLVPLPAWHWLRGSGSGHMQERGPPLLLAVGDWAVELASGRVGSVAYLDPQGHGLTFAFADTLETDWLKPSALRPPCTEERAAGTAFHDARDEKAAVAAVEQERQSAAAERRRLLGLPVFASEEHCCDAEAERERGEEQQRAAAARREGLGLPVDATETACVAAEGAAAAVQQGELIAGVRLVNLPEFWDEESQTRLGGIFKVTSTCKSPPPPPSNLMG